MSPDPRTHQLPVPRYRSARWLSAAVCLVSIAGLLPASAMVVEKPALGPSGEASTVAAALVTAKASGKPVLITSKTTETTEYRALPSGLIEAIIAAGPVRMRGANGSWIAVDVSLVRQADGSVTSKAHPYGLKLSGPARSGDHDLVELGAPGRGSRLGWSGRLPAPELDGTTATYREVKPGVDLVVQATRTGYEQQLVVKSRQAAVQLKQLRMPWKVDGPATSPASVMWDSTVDKASGEHLRRAPVKLALGKDALLLTPDASFLTDPKTVYPVTIDPSQSSGPNFDAFVQSSYSTDQSAATELKIGTYDSGANKARSYLRFDNQDWLWDKQIQAATLSLWEHHSYSCTARGWVAYRVADVTNTARWTNRPAQYEQVGTSTQTKGFSSSCGAGWVTIPVTAAFQYTAAHRLSKTNIGISAASETDNYGWKRFNSREGANPPSVTITYQTKTSVDAQATAPDTACVTGADRPAMSTLNPQLRAQISDTQGAQVYAVFEWKVVGGITSSTATEGPGASGSWLGTTIPDDAFTEGSSYAWRVQGTDGTTPGEWSNWCEFTVITM
ncbi:DNRLRE domain-containing protein [Kribbella monticola]|uniref:DNRLRE domain-containing protein n=1 Tax=Kribbella monticola TaxID=2185285 RepID=UPI001300ACA2|nr:DNRLRE domain-containing protein [Kribbella monticola]